MIFKRDTLDPLMAEDIARAQQAEADIREVVRQRRLAGLPVPMTPQAAGVAPPTRQSTVVSLDTSEETLREMKELDERLAEGL